MSSTSVGVFRSAATVTAWNALSRLTGFARVLVVGAALGATFLGNTYQSANLVSNVLFEVLAAGILAAPLVPILVRLISGGERSAAERVVGTLLCVSVVGLGLVALAGALAGEQVMRLLTSGSPRAVREAQVELGSYWLWFFLPQLVFYAVGAVATAALNAQRRFAAAAAAPVVNNLVAIGTMALFIAVRSSPTGQLDLTGTERMIIGAGTSVGVAAMSALPLVALLAGGFRPRLGFSLRHPDLRPLGVVGRWALVFVAANQIVIAVSLVLANRVAGGVVAYQIALTFFLLPHALFAQPIATTALPALAERHQRGEVDEMAAEVASAARVLLFIVLPVSAVLAALSTPLLRLVAFGALERAAIPLIGRVLTAFALGIAGYGALFLLGRAQMATGDTRTPALVLTATAVLGATLMIVGVAMTAGADEVVTIGVSTAIAFSVGAVVQHALLVRRIARPIPVLATLLRAGTVAVAMGAVARFVATGIDGTTRAGAAATLLAGGTAALMVGVAGHATLRSPEVAAARSMLTRSA